jgi:hypothetical protein
VANVRLHAGSGHCRSRVSDGDEDRVKEDEEAVPTQLKGEPAGQHVELTAQWALWGRGADDRVSSVLASSAEDLTARDFTGAVERYAAGAPDRLPQYTVFWVPDVEGAPRFVGIAIHEHASYARQDDRSHYDASGREIVYSRLFCVRYADLAEHGVTFTGLLLAVQHQLLPRDQAAPVTLRIAPEREQRLPSSGQAPGTGSELAEVVAALLLTTRQVCVLGADEVSATERLAFIDQVLSLLPYGLRATLSAATWASPTARDLKLRLFFASAQRDDSDGVHHVRWDQRTPDAYPVSGNETAGRYLDWLRGTGAQAPFLLTEQTAPLRFNDADLSAMVGALPRDLKVANVLQDLVDSLREGDVAAAMTEIKRLRRNRIGPVRPADREHYRYQILRHGLLDNHPALRSRDRAAVYQTLLRLAFELPISYDSYCAIEDAVGGPPRGTLRSVLQEFSFASYVPWLLAAKGEIRVSDEELTTTLKERNVSATAPLDQFQRDLVSIRPAHRAAACDFALLYLRSQAENAKPELTRRGYLAEILAASFPDDTEAQRVRLEGALKFVHGGSLSRGQIRDLFSEPGVRPTAAFEAAVGRLASSPKAERLIAEQAAEALTRNAGNGDKGTSDRAESHRGHRPQLWHLLTRLLVGGPRDPVS